MFRADDYVKVSDLAEAYELCQKRSSLVVGGMVWMKMTHITKRTIVDLSGLGLDEIEEKEGEFSIGCMRDWQGVYDSDFRRLNPRTG